MKKYILSKCIGNLTFLVGLSHFEKDLKNEFVVSVVADKIIGITMTID